jgi:murein DD-endopeptidase MepM/ murein hydrolase activator NlpD
VKKILIIVLAVVAVVIAAETDSSGRVSGILNKLALPFKLAALYTKEPDSDLSVPIDGVRVRQIAETWHAPRGRGRLHEGEDIFAPKGAPIYSATRGYVISIGENSLGGNSVWVFGAGGRRYYYAHLDSYASYLSVGDYVTPETIIGFVGTTGNAAGTPPHLHFGVYTNGGPIDPLPLLRDRTPVTKTTTHRSARSSAILHAAALSTFGT